MSTATLPAPTSPQQTDTPAAKAAAAGAAPAAPRTSFGLAPGPEGQKREQEGLDAVFAKRPAHNPEQPGPFDEDHWPQEKPAVEKAKPEAPEAQATEHGDEGDTAAGENPEAKPAETPETDSEDYRKAIQALRRDGYQTDEIDELAKNPERLTALGLRAAKRQAEQDDLGRQLAELKKQAAKDSGQADPGEGEPAAPPELSQALAAASEPLARLLSEDAGIEGKAAQEAIGAYTTAIAETVRRHTLATVQPALERLQQQNAVIGSLLFTENESGMLDGYLVREARRDLTQKYPQLADDATFQKVQAAMRKFDRGSYGGDLAAWMSDGARLALADEKLAERQSREARLKQHKANGSPEPPTTTPTDSGIPAQFARLDPEAAYIAARRDPNITPEQARAIHEKAKAQQARQRARAG